MESVKAFKFMNGWMVKYKDIDKIEETIWVNRTLTLESLYVYGDRFIEESYRFVIMKAGTKYLVLDITALCKSCKGGFGSDNLYSLYDLLEGKF